MQRLRPARLCRSWLFIEGANEAALSRAPTSGADVLIQELEDFTPPLLRPKARAAGHSRVEFDGALVELPAYATAKLLARHETMREFERGD